jgi:superfamily II DNA or RNA helicase
MFNREIANQEKNFIQAQAVEMSSDHKHLLLTWATGCGKSYAAIKCIKNKLEENKRILLLVKETNHQSNWEAEFKSLGETALWERTDCYCYHSLPKVMHKKYGVVVLDEVHALSELREFRLGTIEFDFLCSLSATIDSSVKLRLRSLCPYKEFHISTQEAIDRGILPAPEIVIFKEELDDTEVVFPAKFGKKTVMLTQYKYYQKICSSIDYWKGKIQEEKDKIQEKKDLAAYKGQDPSTITDVVPMYLQNKLLQCLTERKRWIANQKTKIAKDIIEFLGETRFICFCGSVDQAIELGKDRAIHSRNKKTKKNNVNLKIIEAFNNEEISSIMTCQMLTEGQNLSNPQAAVLIQLDGVDRTGIQRLGRALRGTDPKVYIVMLNGTRDVTYVDRFLEGMNPEWIHYV